MRRKLNKDLDDKLDVGMLWAKQLAQHLLEMGASKCELPVEIHYRKFLITIEELPEE